MGHRRTVTSVLVAAAVLLPVLGATPAAGAVTPCPAGAPQQRDAVFEWHRLSEVNTSVTDQRLRDLQCGGFKTVYADISEYVEVAFHLIDMLRADPQAYLLVMAYRNFTSSADGSIALVSAEFEYAKTTAAACGIVIGQEFGLVEPRNISFGWVGRAAFRQAAGELVTAYGGRSQFRGLSVNDLDAYEATPDYVTG